MVFKEGLTFLLVLGIWQIGMSDAKDKYKGNRVRRSENGPKHHFEKYSNRWDDKIYFKDDSAIKSDSKVYVDKFNKYGNTFNPNHLDKQYIGKKKFYDLESEDLLQEIDNNHINNKSHGEDISLLHDIDVNYIDNKSKESDKDNDVERLNVLVNTDVNYIDNKNQKDDKDNDGEKFNVLVNTDANYKKNRKSSDNDKLHNFVSHSSKSKEEYQKNYQNQKSQMKRYKKDISKKKKFFGSKPPINDTVLMARYIVHTVDWAALATLSGHPATKGAPFVCEKAFSDGLADASTGIPYFYMSSLDLCTQDLKKDNRVSVLVTLSETNYCKKNNYDPQDPRCAKLSLSGTIDVIQAGSEDEKFAKTALFTRHPAMAKWPSDHNWYFTKLHISQIVLLDRFGGATFINVKDYLKAKLPKL